MNFQPLLHYISVKTMQRILIKILSGRARRSNSAYTVATLKARSMITMKYDSRGIKYLGCGILCYSINHLSTCQLSRSYTDETSGFLSHGDNKLCRDYEEFSWPFMLRISRNRVHYRGLGTRTAKILIHSRSISIHRCSSSSIISDTMANVPVANEERASIHCKTHNSRNFSCLGFLVFSTFASHPVVTF